MIDLMIAALAVYRIAHLVAFEDGPFDLFLRLRDRAMVRLGSNHWITVGMHCPLCISFWLAWLIPLTPLLVTQSLAVAGIVLMLHSSNDALGRIGGA